MHHDVHHRLIDDEQVTSPVILNHRFNVQPRYAELVKSLIQDIYR